MYLVLMLLISTGVTTDEPTLINSTEGEWLASGYSIVLETTIDPLDYDGEPMGTNPRMDNAIQLGCLSFFVQTEDGEKWRIVMVFRDKVIVVQEDSETREIPLTISGNGVFFSKGGKYVLVHGGLYNTNANELINIDEGTSEFFDYGLTDGATFTWVGDQGTVLTYLKPGRYSGEGGLLSFYNHSQLVNTIEGVFIPAMSHDGSLIVCGVYPTDNIEDFYLTAYNNAGQMLWSRDVPTDMRFMMNGVSMPQDGEFLIIYGPNGGLECYSGGEGELLWSNSSSGGYAPISSSGEYCSFGWESPMNRELPPPERRGGTVTCRITDLLIDSDNLQVENFFGGELVVSNDGCCLSIGYGTNSMPKTQIRYYLTDSTSSVLWMSPWFDVETGSHFCGFKNNNIEPNMGDSNAALSSDGRRVVYDDDFIIRIIRIEKDGAE